MQGPIADPKYSPLFTFGNDVVYDGAQVANATGQNPKVLALEPRRRLVQVRLTQGRYLNRMVLYLSTESSDIVVAALENATYTPNLGAAPKVGSDSRTRSAREAIIPIVNGPRGVHNPQRQGLRSAVAGEGDPLNIIREDVAELRVRRGRSRSDGQCSSPSDAAPSVVPIASSASTLKTSRRPVCLRAMPSSSRSSSNGSMRTFESEPMQRRMPRWRTRSTGRKPSPRFASVVGHAQMRDAGLREQVELASVGVRRVHDRRPRPEAAAVGEELDRADAVLGEALLDLARLLVGVHVERQLVLVRVAAELFEPVARAGAHGVGGDADADACAAQLLELAEIGGDRLLPEAVDAAARVRDVEEDELDRPPRPRRRRRRAPPRGRDSGTRRRRCSPRRAARGRSTT